MKTIDELITAKETEIGRLIAERDTLADALRDAAEEFGRSHCRSCPYWDATDYDRNRHKCVCSKDRPCFKQAWESLLANINHKGCKRVWCLLEESSHEDPYDRDNDGCFVIGVYDSRDKAKEAMEREFRKQDVNEETDSVDRSESSIALSKWVKVKDDNQPTGARLDHDCDVTWTIQETEVQ